MQSKTGLCGICPAGCWVKISYDKEGRLDKVEPDTESGHGMICKIGEHSKEIVYSEHRLEYPMKRKGKKGDYDFERITWEEAYNIIVDKLQTIKREHGPEATAIYTGRGSFELALCDVFQPEDVAISSASSVLFPFGSPNTLGVGALCYVSFAMIAPHVTMGGMYHNMYSDIENAEMVMVWGANPATDSPPADFYRVQEAHEKGARIIVIDPRKTALAKMDGAEWIPVRPGTDGALALGMCNVIIQEELYDTDFVKNWTVGFDDFSTYAQQFQPALVEEITGVSQNKIKRLAREMVSSNGVAPVMYTGLEYTNSGVQNIRAVFVLWALTGNLDVPGGRCFSMKENQFRVNREGLIPNPDVKKALGRDRFPVYSNYRGESHAISLPESVLKGHPYKIRSLIIHGGSIITSWPQPQIWKDTLRELEFLVCIDRQLTADAAYADIVLPATTMYEIDSYKIYGNTFRLREKIIEPVGEARNDFFIMAELAECLGYGEKFPQNEQELYEYVLKNTGFTLDEVKKNGGMVSKEGVMTEYKKWEKGLLREDRKPGFETPSGKFEIASTILEENGYSALPEFTEPEEGPLTTPDLLGNYPLIFNSGSRVTTDFRSQHHGIPGLLKERPEPVVTMNSKDAEARNIKNGDEVVIRTRRGEVSYRAYVTEDIMEGCVDANMGGGGPVGPEAWQKCNVNELTDLMNYDPVSGFPVYKTLLCEVEKISSATGETVRDSGEMKLADYAEEASGYPDRRIYLDNNATTPLAEEVRDVMAGLMDQNGNPSGLYREGRQARKIVEAARRNTANLINTTAKRIIFTSGGSESNNAAIKGAVFKNTDSRKNHIITSAIEHPSVLNTCKWLESKGYEITYIPVNQYGMIDIGDFIDAIRPDTMLASIMLANNEIGTVQPVKQLAEIAHQHDILFHTDAVQAIGKISVDAEDLNVDFLTLSGHKLHAPKGIGALYQRKGIEIDPLISGGSQESRRRAGTENLMGIAALGKAAELAVRHLTIQHNVLELRNTLEKGIMEIFPDCKLNGHPSERLPNTLNMVIPGVRGESLVLSLDRKGISLSSGSACRSGSPEPSHVLLAIGLSADEAHCCIRFSLGRQNTKKEIDYTLGSIKRIKTEMKDKIRFVSCR